MEQEASPRKSDSRRSSGIRETFSVDQSAFYNSGREALRSQQIEAKTSSLRQLDAQLQELYRQVDALGQYDLQVKAVDMAISRIQELSSGMYRESGRDYLDRAGEILAGLTGGRYGAVSVDEKGHARINTPDRLLELNQVSFGTMQQIYLALRLAGAEQAGLTRVPLVLDETFAMYDDERLGAAMQWLYESGRQVILFCCQTREKQVLDAIRAQR